MPAWSLPLPKVPSLNRRKPVTAVRSFLSGIFLILLPLTHVPSVAASPPFDRVPTDKWAHFLGSAYLTEYGQNHYQNGTVVIGVATLGLGKEIYDSVVMREPWDWGDLFADGLGMGLALFLN